MDILAFVKMITHVNFHLFVYQQHANAKMEDGGMDLTVVYSFFNCLSKLIAMKKIS